jgi:hypothetical protein
MTPEMAFKATARRNKAVGLWAAELLGKTGDAAEAYAMEVIPPISRRTATTTWCASWSRTWPARPTRPRSAPRWTNCLLAAQGAVDETGLSLIIFMNPAHLRARGECGRRRPGAPPLAARLVHPRMPDDPARRPPERASGRARHAAGRWRHRDQPVQHGPRPGDAPELWNTDHPTASARSMPGGRGRVGPVPDQHLRRQRQPAEAARRRAGCAS